VGDEDEPRIVPLPVVPVTYSAALGAGLAVPDVEALAGPTSPRAGQRWASENKDDRLEVPLAVEVLAQCMLAAGVESPADLPGMEEARSGETVWSEDCELCR
jgi:hypothetical protein